MPIVLGLASSHAPSMFCEADQWPVVHRGLVQEVPQPPEIALETQAVIEDYVRRIRKGFDTLREEIQRHRLDAIIIVGDDQEEVFSSACNPTLAVFVGKKMTGSTSISWIGQKRADNHIALTGHPALAMATAEGLLARGFDPALMDEIKAAARPEGGLGHAFTRVARAVGLHESGLPAIPLFVNSYHPPLPSAARCYALGKALAETFADRPERIGLYGSGGLSHCPRGPRAGWVDEPLDRWVLEQIEHGRGAQLQNLFTFDSDTLRSGTGEIRSWIVAAGAFDGTKGVVVDYLPARHAVTGLGFAYWHRS